MVKRILIAGCRNYYDYSEIKKYIDFCIKDLRKNNEIIIISGGCNGVDKLGEKYATENGFKVELHPAEWKKYGKFAGPKRNREMVKSSDYVICFWDGKSKGTKSTIDFSIQMNKPIRIKNILVKKY